MGLAIVHPDDVEKGNSVRDRRRKDEEEFKKAAAEKAGGDDVPRRIPAFVVRFLNQCQGHCSNCVGIAVIMFSFKAF